MKKRTPTRLSAQDISIAKIRNVLRGNTKRLRPTFSKIRKDAPEETYPLLINEFYKHPFYQQELFGPPFPKVFSQIKRRLPLYSIGLDKEISWAACLLHAHQSQLSEFLKFKRKLSQLTLSECHAEALTELDALDQNVGVSLWSTALRLFHLYQHRGIEAQQELVREFRAAQETNGYAYYLAYYFSYRAQTGASLTQIQTS
jgi:hypothetical protein